MPQSNENKIEGLFFWDFLNFFIPLQYLIMASSICPFLLQPIISLKERPNEAGIIIFLNSISVFCGEWVVFLTALLFLYILLTPLKSEMNRYLTVYQRGLDLRIRNLNNRSYSYLTVPIQQHHGELVNHNERFNSLIQTLENSNNRTHTTDNSKISEPIKEELIKEETVKEEKIDVKDPMERMEV